MIRTETEYREAQRHLADGRRVAEQQRAAFTARGLSSDEVEAAIEPLLAFQAGIAEEARLYECLRQGKFPAIRRLTGLGRLLIGARIATGLSQKELADRLGVSEAVVSHDERNEYHAVSVQKAQRVLDAVGVTLELALFVPQPSHPATSGVTSAAL